MNRALARMRRFLVGQDGPTAVEYAVLLAVIAAVCLSAIKGLGTTMSGAFGSVPSAPGGSRAGGPPPSPPPLSPSTSHSSGG